MEDYQKPGESVRRSGIYRVTHDPMCLDEHEATCILGHLLPACSSCGDNVRFTLSQYAIDLEHHPAFKT